MAHENQYKYLKPPTIQEIEAAVAAENVSEAQFERFHGIYEGCIRQIRFGIRQMPAKHWHLFFETATVSKPVSQTTTKTAEKRTIPETTLKAASRAKNLT